MQLLNLPAYSFKTKTIHQKKLIFDSIRKKYVALTPEEWVRQHFIQYLVQEKHFPASLIAIEMPMHLNRLKKRSDVVIYDSSGKPIVIVECKAPSVKITQDTFDQIARYNLVLKVAYLIVTNGITHFCCHVDNTKNDYSFLEEIPEYAAL